MKGGGHQLRLDVRRRWGCDECGKSRRTDGSTTAVRCGCGEWMTLTDLPAGGFPPPLHFRPNVPHVEEERPGDAIE